MLQTITKKNFLYLFIGLAIGALAMFLLQQYVLPPSVETTLLKTSNELNRNCPVMIDKITRFDNTSVISDKEFRFNYTILNAVKDSVDLKMLRQYLEPIVNQGIKNNHSLEYLRKNKVTISCTYKDRNGITLVEIK